jgi:hypothetical protein
MLGCAIAASLTAAPAGQPPARQAMQITAQGNVVTVGGTKLKVAPAPVLTVAAEPLR